MEAKIVEDPGQWPWSSYKAIIGASKPPDFLFVDDILSCMNTSRKNAKMLLKELVRMKLQGNDDQIIALFQKIYGENRNLSVSKRVGPVLDVKNSLGAVPRNQRILSRPELEELFTGVQYGDLKTRNRKICDAFRLYAYTQSEIAEFLELDRTTISKAANKTN